jgi:putative peptide zinc metalloprotease protein
VKTGDQLLRMKSPELLLELTAAEADLQQVEARERQMLSDLAAGIEPMKRRREAVMARLERLEKDRTSLDILAPATGTWVSPRSDAWAGLWLPRGARLGEVVGDGPDWEFQAVVNQNDARSLFAANAAKERAELRFHGSSGRVVTVTGWSVVPGRQEVLPSPALGWKARGPIRVRADDENGVRADQPFFLVTGRIPADGVETSDELGPVLWQGRTGVMRFDMPWSPLLVQWVRSFRQLLQERYRI